MASYVTPKKNTAFVTYIGLVDQSNTKLLKANPTLASADFKVSIDGGALNTLTTLPAVTPASSVMVKVQLSAAEMNGDNITLVCSDASGAEWCDQLINIQTTTRQIDDLAYPATSGRPVLVDASGNIGIQTNLKKGQALSAYTFLMTDSTNHNPATSKTVTATRSLDGAAFGSGTLSAVSELSNGIYKVDIGSGDMNANVVTLRFTATGCDDLFITLVTEP